MDSALGTDCETDCEGELRSESLDEEGTACGFDASGGSFAMAAVIIASVACGGASAELPSSRRLFVCNVGDSNLRGSSQLKNVWRAREPHKRTEKLFCGTWSSCTSGERTEMGRKQT